MLEMLYHTLFLLFTVFVLFETIYYAVYEIKDFKNKFGGISLIIFSVFCVVFSNIVIFIK